MRRRHDIDRQRALTAPHPFACADEREGKHRPEDDACRRPDQSRFDGIVDEEDAPNGECCTSDPHRPARTDPFLKAWRRGSGRRRLGLHWRDRHRRWRGRGLAWRRQLLHQGLGGLRLVLCGPAMGKRHRIAVLSFRLRSLIAASALPSWSWRPRMFEKNQTNSAAIISVDSMRPRAPVACRLWRSPR